MTINYRPKVTEQIEREKQNAQIAWCAKRLLELDEAAAEATGMNLDNTIPGDAIEAAICALNNPGVFAKGSSPC